MIDLVLPLEYNVDKQVCMIESNVPRVLFGMSPPNVAKQAAKAFEDISLFFFWIKNKHHVLE